MAKRIVIPPTGLAAGANVIIPAVITLPRNAANLRIALTREQRSLVLCLRQRQK